MDPLSETEIETEIEAAGAKLQRWHKAFKRAMLAAAAFASLGMTPKAWSGELQGIHVEPTSGIGFKVYSDFNTLDFNTLPSSHTAPFHVEISNHSGRDGTWRVSFWSPYHRSDVSKTVHLRVEAGQTRTFPVEVPLSARSWSDPSLQVRAFGPGIADGSTGVGTSSERGATPAIAMSEEIGMRSFEPLKKAWEKERGNLADLRFQSGRLPEQWYGFSGVKWLVLAEHEWTSLTPQVRAAMRRWIGSGGHLIVAARNTAAVPWTGWKFGPGAGPHAYGNGDVRALEWDGREISPEALKPFLLGTSSGEIRNEDAASWAVLAGLGDSPSNRVLVFIVVVVLAIVLGPLNLFLLAPASRRYRMFVTTPLLSLGASALLFAGIVLKDGFGGSGRRMALVQIFPEEHEALMIQDQASRTGLLLSRKFPLQEGVEINQVALKGSTQNAMDLTDGICSGGWFNSGRKQVQRLATLRPTRAALTLAWRDPTGAPQVVSSFPGTLKEVVLKDAGGKWWRGTDLRAGEAVVLKPALPEDGWNFWKETMADFPLYSRARLEEAHGSGALFGKTGYFYATLAEPEGGMIPTLASIRWKDQAAVFGPVSMPNGAPAELATEGGAR